MSGYLQVDGEEFIHLSNIRRLRVVSTEERQSLAKLGNHVDADRFNTRIDHEDSSRSYAPETIQQLSDQARLVQVEDGAFVPAQNIKRVRALTQKDRDSFAQRTGREMRGDYKSQVRTSAGLVLSTEEPKALMDRMGQPSRAPAHGKQTQKADHNPEPAPTDKPPAQGLEAQRDAVMKQAAPSKQNAGPARQPER